MNLYLIDDSRLIVSAFFSKEIVGAYLRLAILVYLANCAQSGTLKHVQSKTPLADLKAFASP
jgi:hypothetical protein